MHFQLDWAAQMNRYETISKQMKTINDVNLKGRIYKSRITRSIFIEEE